MFVFVLALLQSAGPEAAEPKVVPPTWELNSSANDIFLYFPNRAVKEGVPGRVRLKCIAAVDHRLKDCSVIEEEPKGYGFGQAAVDWAQTRARMKPQTVDGVAEESEVDFAAPFPVWFRKSRKPK